MNRPPPSLAPRGRSGILDRWSLRARLVAAVLVLVAASIVLSTAATTGVLRGYLLGRVDDSLAAATGPLLGRGGLAGPGGARDQGRRGRAELPSTLLVEIRDADGMLVTRLRNPLRDEPAPALPPLTVTEVRDRAGMPFTVAGQPAPWRVLARPVRDEGSLVVATSLSDVQATVRRLGLIQLLAGAAVLGLAAGAALLAVRASLRPLAHIEATAAAIAAGDLSRRVPVPAPGTEVGRLSAALNGMLGQIERAFRARSESEARMRRFVADAGHELRTPLTSIRGFAELYRQGALRDRDELTRAMGRIEDEAVRMGGLVDDLVLLARLDEQRPLERAPVDLVVVASDAVHDAGAAYGDPPLSLAIDTPSVLVAGDEGRLRQVVANLVRNALTHPPAGTPVLVRVAAADDCAIVEVADDGPGLTPEQAARVFDRFYRVDPSRRRDSGGGAGLGLSIVAAIVAAHGGRIDLDTAPGSGAVFRVELPLTSPYRTA